MAYPDSDQVTAGGTILQPLYAFVNATGTHTLVAAVAGKKIRVINGVAISVTAGTVTYKSATSAISPDFSCGITGGFVLPWSPSGHFITATGEALAVTVTANTAVLVTYVLV